MDPREGLVARDLAWPPVATVANEHGVAAIAEEDEDGNAARRPSLLDGDPFDARSNARVVVGVDARPKT